MKAIIVRTLLILVSLFLLVQLWIFSSLVWWRTHPVETTMFMRLDYWADRSQPIQHEWRDYDQLAKNLFLYNKRSFLRKGQEAIATWMMERMWTKQRILEVYMNSVEFGENIYGVEAATQHYFGKSSHSLSREQAAFLAALLPNPKYYDENRNDRKLQYRKRMISKYMRYSHIP